MKNKNLPFQILLILFALGFTTLLLKQCNTNQLHKNQLKAATDTTVYYRNKSNQLEAKKTVFVTDNKSDAKAEIERWKAQGIDVQNKLNRSTKQLIILKRELEIVKSGTINIPKTDTVYISDVVIEKPNISIDTGDAFHTLKFAANNDKYAYQIKITDDSELKVEDKGKKGTVVTLLNKNPYVISSEIKSILIKPKNKSFNKFVYLGAGLLGGYLIFK